MGGGGGNEWMYTHTHTTHIKTMRFKHGSHTKQKTISENMEDAHYHRVACW